MVEKFKVIAIYADMRDSTKIVDLTKKRDACSDFYKSFKGINHRAGGYSFSNKYPAGDGILLVAKCEILEVKKLEWLLKEVQGAFNKFNKKGHEIQIGIGISYGDAVNIQTESNLGGTESETVGTPLDIAAKSSNFGCKNSSQQWFISNNKKKVSNLPGLYNSDLIHNLKEITALTNVKESYVGNFRFDVKE